MAQETIVTTSTTASSLNQTSRDKVRGGCEALTLERKTQAYYIVRFVSREDRELVWSKRGKMKQLHQVEEAYITEDYARAIQKERQILIKAMMKARNDEMDNVKLTGRFL